MSNVEGDYSPFQARRITNTNKKQETRNKEFRTPNVEGDHTPFRAGRIPNTNKKQETRNKEQGISKVEQRNCER
jgi:hypothetical protein